MAPVIIPNVAFNHVMHDPFGIGVILNNETYAAPNRFFAHWTMMKYFRSVPLFLQNFISPLNSVYAACAIAKTVMQLMMILILSSFISGTSRILRKDFLVASVIITPMFQIAGYYETMGIITRSITYSFFYALPIMLLLLFFLSFYLKFSKQKPIVFNPVLKIVLLVLIIFLSFNGPLIQGVILIACPLILFQKFGFHFRNQNENSFFKKVRLSLKKIPVQLVFYLSVFSLLCLYSLYIGTYNSENFEVTVPVTERYLKLLSGLYSYLTDRLGIPLLMLSVLINFFLLKKFGDKAQTGKILIMMKWICFFIVAYLLLLPLGGFRIYRSNILRFDTAIPITICLIFLFGISTFFLLNNLSGKLRTPFLIYTSLLLLNFTLVDNSLVWGNYFEREAITQIVNSKKDIVEVAGNTPVMSWENITDYKNSEMNSELLQIWNVTKEKKLYYQK